MTSVLSGIRVVEVSLWGFVASTGAVLADWGADVRKVEHPEYGDPIRGLRMAAYEPPGGGHVPFMWHIPNRGKKSLAIDLATDDGRGLLYRMVEESDVFLTSFLPGARRRLKIDLEDIRRVNPRIIYVRGHGQGTKGPEAEWGGFDSAMFWARSGAALATTGEGAPAPIGSPGPAFGDFTAGALLAGGVAAALLHRERTSEASTVDLSLLGAGTWAMGPGITAADLYGIGPSRKLGPPAEPKPVPNPLGTHAYRTADDRFIVFAFLQPDRYYAQFCEIIGRPDLLSDSRFVDMAARREHSVEFQKEVGGVIGSMPLEHWKWAFDGCEGVWTVAQLPAELLTDRQMLENGYLRPITTTDGVTFHVVASPVSFDERQPDLSAGPDHGADTDAELRALGLSEEEITDLKIKGVVL